MKGLTQRQEAILEYIAEYLVDHSYPPSYQEIADAFDIVSKNGVVRHLKALIRKGYIEKTDTSARSIRIIDQKYQSSNNMVNVPLVGRVAAGFPILAEENIEDYISVPRKIIKTEGRYFALRVQGDSMINAGIFDGDLVIVRSANRAISNDIVVALLEDEVTVKRLVTERDQTFLKAENPEYPNIHPQQEWNIQGKVVGLIRDSVQ
jgi:repressor LexA